MSKTTDKKNLRILIFVVSYNAASTIHSVLERIYSVPLDHTVHILIIDDCSSDEGFDEASKYKTTNGKTNIDVLYNPRNQGYGGNQKLGYQYAMENDFDIVVLLHGDAQYPPEKIPELIDPIVKGEADLVLGSRMLVKRQALQGNMPLYKYCGNKLLTSLQNMMLKSDLSEYHTGFRAYRVSSLKTIPFKYNTNDFHFDTEIIIQFMLAGYPIREIPIPTHYGDEVCHVNSWKYGLQVIKSCLLLKLHNAGVCYQNNFDLSRQQEEYTLKLGYTSSHSLALAKVPDGAKVLDVGCSNDGLAELMKQKNAVVHALGQTDMGQSPNMDVYHQCNLNQFNLESLDQDYDVILLLDIVEHLDRPEKLLHDIREHVADPSRTSICISVPNTAFLLVRLSLLFGKFQYGKQGILDLTHKRLFTQSSILKVLEQEGFRVRGITGIPAPFPKAFGDTVMARLLLNVNKALIRLSRTLFSYQLFIEASTKPSLTQLLRESREAAAKRLHPGA